jgi:hypothetical protein
MPRAVPFVLCAGVGLVLAITATPVVRADAEGVVRLATLPPGAPGHPEGLAADAAGNGQVTLTSHPCEESCTE